MKGAELSGFSPGSKLLIIHADDFGMCSSVNQAIIAALEAGAVSSASAMVPCPGFSEAAEWSASHPEYDVGVHSTLISEWRTYKWGPVSRVAHGAGLVDEQGHFWPRNRLLRAPSEEVKTEIAAQISLAKRAGMVPSHVDSHMLSVARPGYIEAYIEAAIEFELPFLIDEYWHSYCSSHLSEMPANAVVNSLVQADASLSIDSLEEYYVSTLRDLKPGLHQLILHPAFDSRELRHITGDCRAYGAAWRQRDFEIVMGDRFRSALQQNQIQVVNWRSVSASMSKQMANVSVDTRAT